jgi:hypothetical protein
MDVAIIGEFIECPLYVLTSGSSAFTYNATVDYGDGVLESLIISENDKIANQPDFVTLFRHRYTEKGTYSINFLVNSLNVNWTIEENLVIRGKLESFIN